jgi:hypothetical protein
LCEIPFFLPFEGIMAPAAASTRLQTYSPHPYSSDGGFSATGLFLTTVVGIAVAVVLGVAAGIVGQFFYAVLLFPIGIGLAVGAAMHWVIQYTKIRTPVACGVAGLVAGIVAAATMHYCNYVCFQRQMQEAALDEKEMLADLATTSDASERDYLRAALAEYQADPEVAAAREVDSITSYMDFSARQGVEISPMHGQSSGLNLGYTGTYVYWATEAFIVAFIAAAVARRRASAPFCLKCDNWKATRELGALSAAPKAVAELVQSGRLMDLSGIPASKKHEAAISVCECPSCPNEGEVVIQVDQVTYNKGQRTKSPIARAIYPRAAADELTQFFAPAASPAA